MKYLKNKFVLAAAACLLAVAAFFAFSGDGEKAPERETRRPKTSRQARKTQDRPRAERREAAKPAAKEKAAKTQRKRAAKPVLSIGGGDDDDDDSNRTPAEKALAKSIETALDDENLQLARQCAASALSCGDAEIRQSMVETLGWFGAEALAELTPFLADPDEDVRDAAQSEWSMALSDIEDESEKALTIEMAMQVITDDDMLDEISDEYIGLDELIAVNSLVRIIEAGGKSGDKAKETYEFVTGEEFTGRESAERWLAEEYTPSDGD